MSPKMKLGLEMVQQLTLAQRLEMQLEMVQRMGYSIQNVLGRTDDAPERLLDDVIAKVVNSIEHPQIKEGITALLSDTDLRKKMISESARLAVPTKQRIREFVADYIYESQHGRFRVDESLETPEIAVEKGIFIGALLQPEAVAQEAEQLRAEFQARPQNRAAELRLNQVEIAIQIANAAQASLTTLEQAFTLTLMKTNNAGHPALTDFFRDLTVLKTLTPRVSDRIQKRFVSAFTRVRTMGNEGAKIAFLNTIAEYALASMGILSDELFILQKGDVDAAKYDNTKHALAALGIDVDQLLRQYGMKPAAGVFFYHRWHIVGQKLSPTTDDAIREFITKTVRTDADEILNDSDYSSFLEKAKEAASIKNKNDKEHALRTLVTETLASSTFETKLVELIRKKWYVELDKFLKEGKTPT